MVTMDNKMTLKRSLTKDICQAGMALLFFLLGVLIYIGFRSDNLMMFEWAYAVGLDSTIRYIREGICHIAVGSFVRYSLPDGFWLLAYLLIIDVIWRDESTYKLIFILLLPLIAICFEFFQLAGFVKGFFDIFDLASYIGAILVYKLTKTYLL